MKSWDLCLDLFIYNTVQGGRIEWQFNIVLFSRSYVKLTKNQPWLVFQKMWLVGLWWYDEWWWSPGQIVSKYTYLSYRFFLKNSNQVYRLVAVEYIYSSVTSPGQGKPQLAYKVGQLKIIELRELTETSLAENFDIKEFHDIVLNSVGLLAV